MIFYVYEYETHFHTFGAIPKNSMMVDRHEMTIPTGVPFFIVR